MTTLIWVIGFIISLVLSVTAAIWICELPDMFRRRKHPEYFKYYDAGLKICFEASSVVNHEVDYLKHKFDLLTEGLREDECTDEYFKKRFEELAERYTVVTKQFKDQQQEAEKFFRKADLYAKENNLIWGIIY